MVTHSEEIAQLAAESRELSKTANEPVNPILIGLAESVHTVNQATRASNKAVAEAAASIIAAPDVLARAVKEGFQDALGELEKERRLLDETRRVLRIEKQRYLSGIAAFLLLVLAVIGVVFFLFLQPKIDEYQAYRDSHDVLEVGSVYGAHIVDNDNGSFVLFDEGVAVGGLCKDMPNCIAIKD